ncbi:hypothetical protein [Sinorhizobium americanum]|uniref:Uncharacterized protein n=1 Tax=Sinorhizobium americanum TaxID=194963 RepID=A0A4R2BRT5_9HYPH|nr:hypothetical protein [Sinorhizobium americanum]TCN30146.1 hypothetical protein EV184_10812 [Sinorhizobium americanum]
MPNEPDPIAPAGMSSSKLLDVCDQLREAEDFCRAIFMAAAGLHDKENTAVFQSLAEVAKEKIRGAITDLRQL